MRPSDGGWTGAHLAFALSPHYTVKPWRPPFDWRWLGASRRIRFLHGDGRGAVPLAIVAFDPLDTDARHVRLIRRITDVIAVELPGSGHSCGHFLEDFGVLKNALVDICHQRFNADAFVRDVVSRRYEAPQFPRGQKTETAEKPKA